MFDLVIIIVTALFANFCVNMMTYYWRVNLALLKHHNEGHALIAKYNSAGMALLGVLGVAIGVHIVIVSLISLIQYLIGVIIGMLLTSGMVDRWLRPKQMGWLKEL